jgi:hypothetical protein
MSPILKGVVASGISGHLTGALAYESIATVTGNGSSNTLTLSSIPSTYKHLQLRVYARNNRSATNVDTVQIQFNGDTSSTSPFNYTRHAIRYTSGGGSAIAYNVVASSGENVSIGLLPASSVSSSIMGSFITDIHDYANANKYKTVQSLGGYEGNVTYGYIESISAVWMSTSTINSISLINNGSSAFSANTTMALYGIKG